MSELTDFFWPTLTKWSPKDLAEIEAELKEDLAEISRAPWNVEIDLAIEEARRLTSSEEDRAKNAETKATNYLLFAGALIPLLTYLDASVWTEHTNLAPRWLSASLLVLAVLYLLFAGLWAFRAVKVTTYNRVDVTDMLRVWRSRSPKVRTLKEILLAVRSNREAVNHKVSCIKMAHEFLLHAFFVFGLLLVIEAGFQIAHSISNEAIAETPALIPLKMGWEKLPPLPPLVPRQRDHVRQITF